MKSMFAKKKKGGYDSSDSDSSDDKSWKKEMNQAQQMHVLASAGISPSESNTEIDDDVLKRYKKQAKKYFRKR